MKYRPRPGDGSLPPGGNPAARGPGPGQGPSAAGPSAPERAAGQEPRLNADIMLIGGGWHQPDQPEDPQSPGASPDGPDIPAGASDAARAELAAAFGAGFTHTAARDRARRDSGKPGAGEARGFAAGGMLDQMLPGAELGCYLAAARRAGFGRLSDYELCGVIAAYRRQASCEAAGELAAIAELGARRAGPGGRPGEHADAEIAPLLTLTPRGAADLTGLAHDLARLPQTSALLAAGIIDRKRAELIATHLSVLPDDDAAAVEQKITPQGQGARPPGNWPTPSPARSRPTTRKPRSGAGSGRRRTPGSRCGPSRRAPRRWPAATWPRPG